MSDKVFAKTSECNELMRYRERPLTSLKDSIYVLASLLHSLQSKLPTPAYFKRESILTA